ncbi:MAG: bile acid:sodium symporter family protein [Verrucomicrobiales bacterium]|nr:bile acid:sodium symporter family protein [Verrucomicrobiales bacterium]
MELNWVPMLVLAVLVPVALVCSGVRGLRPFSFPAWVLVFVGASMASPNLFATWGGMDLRLLIVPLIQMITFGMGTTLSPEDFKRVLQVPWPVLVGFVLQFTVMPLVGYGLAMGLGFEPEVAAGIILVGSVSGGVASNLVTFLAGGNVALSVTMTACSTLVSPFLTPVLMQVLAGRLVPIDRLAMMFDILNMILVPILAGLVAHRILYGKDAALRRAGTLILISSVCGALALASLWLPAAASGLASMRNGLVIGFGLTGLATLAKLVVEVWLEYSGNWMDRVLSVVSMAGICLIIGIITARSRDKLMVVGPLLLLAAALHNGIGYLLGYWGGRLARLSERDCRTVAIEVGMQNAGMASGLAMSVLNSANAALAPAIFGPLMNLSGAILASWWKRRPPEGIRASQPSSV